MSDRSVLHRVAVATVVLVLGLAASIVAVGQLAEASAHPPAAAIMAMVAGVLLSLLAAGAAVAALVAHQRRLEAESALARLHVESAARAHVEGQRDAFFRLTRTLITVTDLDGHIIEANPAWTSLMGYPLGDVVSRHILHFVHHDDREEGNRQFDRLGSGIVTWSSESRLRRRDGGYRWIEWTASPDLENGLLYFSGRDLTELKEAQAEFERSNLELERFAYVASHDLQEPLRTLASYLRLLSTRHGDHLDHHGREFLGFAEDAALRMQRLIRDWLLYARVGSRPAQRARVDLDRVLERVERSLRQAIAESGAVLTRDALPPVFADGAQLEQLLQNLVANAIKYCGERPPRIHVGAERDGDGWRIAVRDEGIGIAPQHAERVFRVFQRLHPMGPAAGSGLGLALGQRIVEHHGGRIWVDSRPGQGATFAFTLPGSAVRDDATRTAGRSVVPELAAVAPSLSAAPREIAGATVGAS